MSDNQNADRGDGIHNQKSENTPADGTSAGGSAPSARPVKTTESLKSLIKPAKQPVSSTPPDPMAPKISSISARTVPSRTDLKPVEPTAPAVPERESDGNKDPSSVAGGPPPPAPPSVPTLAQPEIEASGLFPWKAALDFIEEDEPDGPQAASQNNSETKASSEENAIEANRTDALDLGTETADTAPVQVPSAPAVVALEPKAEPSVTPVTPPAASSTQNRITPLPDTPPPSDGTLLNAVASRFSSMSATPSTEVPPVEIAQTNPEPANTSPAAPQDIAPRISQTNIPSAPQITEPIIPPPIVIPPQPEPQPIPSPAAAPQQQYEARPDFVPVSPQPTPPAAAPAPPQPTPPPAVPVPAQPTPAPPLAPPSSPTKAEKQPQAAYTDFNPEGISDEEFFDEPMQPPVRSEALASPPSLDMNVNRKFMLIGQTLFDNYAVMDLIGEGSFCYVYTAMQLDADNEAIVAVKTPKVVSPQVKERYQQAVVKQGKLKHPHIIRSLQYLESPDGQPFYIMENKQGVNLEEILQSVEKLDDEDAIALILSQTASALEYAHSHGVTHDRLTPHNILLIDENEQLQVKVTDFQIAAVADITGDTTSKERALCYLSPETLRGELSTPQSDVYSLAAIAFRMVTGKLPFGGKARADAEQLPEPLARYSPDLKQVHMLNQLVQESLDAEPSFRLDTIASFKEAVQEWIQAVHADYSAEPEYYTTEMSRPDLQPPEPDIHPPVPEPQPFAQAPAPPPSALRQEEPMPPASPATPLVVPADELNNLVHDVAPQQRRRIRRAQTRTGAQSIRSTIKELVELKKKQTAQEQTVVMKFTEQVAAQSSGPRRSPLATMTRLIAFIVICGGVTIGCITYILTNPTQVREIYLQSARQLSMLLPGKAQEPEEIAIQEGPKIVKEAVVAPPKKAKLKPTEIHATPPQWAIPRMPGQTNNTSESPSFGVTNNSTATKRRPSRVRIEYRDFEDRPK